MRDRMLFYSDGKFDVKGIIYPPLDKTVATGEALAKAGFHLRIRELYEHNGTGVEVWATPEGKHCVLLRTGKEEVESIFISNRTDWLPFYAGYVVPFIQAQTAMQLNSLIGLIVQKEKDRPDLGELSRELGCLLTEIHNKHSP